MVINYPAWIFEVYLRFNAGRYFSTK